MGKIQILPESLVNKIAAGEVIERPASVVKELLENAIDAGAGRVSVEIESGGHQLIRVTDNGRGMPPEDLKLATLPHATSKISEADDLFHIVTYGFRGEALASIASISHFTLTSRPKDANQGQQLIIEGGQILEDRQFGCAPGTSVEVRQLFFNTPARRKFQKSKGAETTAINEMVLRIAIPHPDIEFRLIKDGVETLTLLAVETPLERIRQIFGHELAAQLIPVIGESPALKLSGFVSSTNETRGNTRSQYFFLNGRFIRDATLISAVNEAYSTFITLKRFAVAFVFLEMDPEEFDVNVHPTKLEVRFGDTKSLFGAVCSSIKAALNQSNLQTVAKLGAPPDPMLNPEQAARDNRIRKSISQFFTEKISPQRDSENLFRETPRREKWSPPTLPPRQPAQAQRADFESAAGSLYADEITLGDLRFVATIHNNYLLFEMGDGFVLVDQHALHERVIYNGLKKKNPGAILSQHLLIPEEYELSQTEEHLLPDLLPLLKEYGFEAHLGKQRTLELTTIPAVLTNGNLRNFLRDLIDALEDQNLAPNERRDVLLKRMACHGAIRSGQKLSASEADALVNEFYKLSPPYTCPHGRPALITFPLREIEKMFKRT